LILNYIRIPANASAPAITAIINNPDDARSPAQATLMAQFGLSLHTVKAQLKQVFAKTGCTRQAEFIRLALSNPILRMCRGY